MMKKKYKLTFPFLDSIPPDNWMLDRDRVKGVYKICFDDGEFYIGRSINVMARFEDHCKEAIKILRYRNNSYGYKIPPKYKRLIKAIHKAEFVTLELISTDLNDEKELIILNSNNKMLNVTHNTYLLKKSDAEEN